MELLGRIIRRLRIPSGQTMTEYALILATIAAVCVSLYNTSGIYLKGLVDNICSAL